LTNLTLGYIFIVEGERKAAESQGSEKMRKMEFYGVCVIEKIGGGIIGLACVNRMAKELPKQTSRIIGNQKGTTYWFSTVPDAQTFYNNTWAKIEKKAV